MHYIAPASHKQVVFWRVYYSTWQQAQWRCVFLFFYWGGLFACLFVLFLVRFSHESNFLVFFFAHSIRVNKGLKIGYMWYTIKGASRRLMDARDTPSPTVVYCATWTLLPVYKVGGTVNWVDDPCWVIGEHGSELTLLPGFCYRFFSYKAVISWY